MLAGIWRGEGIRAGLRLRCVLALGIVALALALRHLLLPPGAGLAFVTFYPAVALSALLLGALPGLLVTVLGAVFGTTVFFAPGTDGAFSREQAVGLPLFFFSGIFVCYLIHLLHRRAQDLQQSQVSFSRLFEHSPSGQLLLDPQTLHVIRCNAAALTIHGVDAAQIVGRAITDFDVGLDAADLAGIRAHLDATGRAAFVTRVRRPDGTIRDIAVTVVLTDAGQGPCLLANHQDITEHKAAEAALRQAMKELDAHQHQLEETVAARTAQLRASAEQSSAILGTMLDGVVHIDAQGRILMVNRAVTQMFGYREVELIGCNVSVLMPEPQRHEHDGYLRRHMQENTSGVLGRFREVTARRKDGSLFVAELATSEMVDEQGIGFIGVLHDISVRKAIDEECENARREAERLARSKSDFLANMSHEIRTPLNGVLGLARMAVRDHGADGSGDIHRRILASAEHLLGIVNDILDFSRIEAGKMGIEMLPLSLPACLDTVHNFISARAEAKSIVLDFSRDTDVPEWVAGDALRLSQILTNLLSNAVKFTEHGSVRLQVRRTGGLLEFCIDDTGIGMSAEHIARLFNPFEQADSSTSRTYGGSGLGLAISQHLAHLMGGEITVQSRIGHGSHFCLCLPLAGVEAPSPEAAVPERAADDALLAGRRVLAVDDVELNRLIIEDLLVHEGAAVELADGAVAALERLADGGASDFDIVLMDVQMPGMDGLEATARIKAIAPDLPVVALTAHAMAEERARCLRAGMVAHIGKPIEARTLISVILQHCRNRSTTGRGGDAPVAKPPPPAGNQPPAGDATPQTKLIDWAGLEAQFRNGSVFVHKLVRRVLYEHGQSPAQLRLYAAQGDTVSLAALAHSVRALSNNMRALRTCALAAATEAACAGDPARAPECGCALAAELDALLAELSHYVLHHE